MPRLAPSHSAFTPPNEPNQGQRRPRVQSTAGDTTDKSFREIQFKRRFKCLLSFASTVLLLLPSSLIAEALRLRTNDVLAFVGGEDVVAMQHYGYVELLLARETASKNLRFRNLAWEGDTVFEQRRDLNFPSWEQTLTKIEATVIVAQFGQAEALRGRDESSHFGQAAADLLGRLVGTNRRVMVLAPTPFEKPPGSMPDLTPNNGTLLACSETLQQLCRQHGWTFVAWQNATRRGSLLMTRDGLHLNAKGHWQLAQQLASALGITSISRKLVPEAVYGRVSPSSAEALRQTIIAKNQLWFDYWRPQNWAFLAGDRTEQPSSRDHRNPKVRWFPNEMERFLPLLEAKEREVRTLAAKLP